MANYIGAKTAGVIANVDGGTISNATVDSTVTFPAGTVIQVETYTEYKVFTQTLDNDTETVGYGSTNFGVSITPKQTGSKNFITISFGALRSGPGGGYALGFRIMRDNTSIKHNTGVDSGASSGYPQLAFRGDAYHEAYNNATTYTLLDETANTKDVQVNYTLLAYRHSNQYSPVIIVNRMDFHSSTTTNMAARDSSTTSHFTVMEIA